MGVCPVCGCKTDELDFIAFKIDSAEEKICTFCEKQLKKFDTSDEPGLAATRWLDSVVEKEIPTRSADISNYLNALNKKFGTPVAEAPPVQALGNQVATIKRDLNSFPNSNAQQGASPVNASQYDELSKRLTALEQSFAKYKKAQLMKTIFELLMPVILIILILIIFFSSGLYDSFSMLMNLNVDALNNINPLDLIDILNL